VKHWPLAVSFSLGAGVFWLVYRFAHLGEAALAIGALVGAGIAREAARSRRKATEHTEAAEAEPERTEARHAAHDALDAAEDAEVEQVRAEVYDAEVEALAAELASVDGDDA